VRTTRFGLAAVTLLALLVPAAPAGAAPTIAEPAATTRTSVATVAPATVVYAPRVPGVHRWLLPVRVRQVIVVSATTWRTTYGTVSLYSRTTTGWRRVGSWPARLGYGGLVVAATRKQDTGTTPAGVFPITQAFGRYPDPGAKLPYTHVNSDHWWVEDRRSRFYNQMRLGSLGGFALRTSGYNSSEHLSTMGTQYDYAAVIDFNRPKPVIGRGAGIFLHVFGRGATGGCVSVSLGHMAAVMRWLDPKASPRIVIGQSTWLAG